MCVGEKLQEALRRAYQVRSVLHADSQTTAYRLFHGYSEGHPGLVIDRYGDTAIVENRGADDREIEIAADVLKELEDFQHILLKERGKESRALVGTLPSEPAVVLEDGLSYWVETWAPRNPGLYLDARAARSWLRDNSEGRRILNLYSFAGSLGVAAMAGGARCVIHVDTQKRALRRCRDNHRLNGQRTDARDQECLDVTKMLRQAAARGRTFGGIIVDPPPPDTGRSEDHEHTTAITLAPLLARVVQPGGWILCFFHHDSRSWDELEADVGEALGRSFERIWRGLSGLDFPENSPERALRLSALRLP